MRKTIFIFLITFLYVSGCRHKEKQPIEFSNNEIAEVISQMTAIMVHDVTNPPLAARFFSYACLAGYQVAAQHDTTNASMSAILNGYPDIQRPPIEDYNWQLASLLAMMETAKKMQPSGTRLEVYEKEFLEVYKKKGLTQNVVDSSRAYALVISKAILAYAKADGYNKISNLSRYIPQKEEGKWFPTPPAYFAAVEPHFKTVRTFYLDSCAQFKPVPPLVFDLQKGSPFYKMMTEDFEKISNATDDHLAIASFWDCNPFAMQHMGHLLIGVKKISPGAHWMGITGIACKKENKSFSESLKIHTIVATGLMDAFIACWDEKFRSNRIRPESVFRKYIDAKWRPLLQTPPFPEYPSGHSTISATSATILSKYFGDDFEFVDSVEVSYGLPARTFSSFREAANEAALSRLYGGIHFTDAIENGAEQGEKVGNFIIKKIEGNSNLIVRE